MGSKNNQRPGSVVELDGVGLGEAKSGMPTVVTHASVLDDLLQREAELEEVLLAHAQDLRRSCRWGTGRARCPWCAQGRRWRRWRELKEAS